MLKVSGNKLKLVKNITYLKVVYMSDARQNKESGTWISKANTTLCVIYRSVVTKPELLNTANLSIFKSVFRPILTFWS